MLTVIARELAAAKPKRLRFGEAGRVRFSTHIVFSAYWIARFRGQ
jgi:hypothetical protein